MKLGIKYLSLQDLRVMKANVSTAVPILEKERGSGISWGDTNSLRGSINYLKTHLGSTALF